MKTIYGLFPSYRDAQGALEEFVRAGFDQADLSALLRAESMNAKAVTPPGRRDRRPPRGNQANPAQPSGAAPPALSLPGGQHIDIPGGPKVLASGRLAAALGGEAVAAKAEPANLQSMLAGTGLPAAFAENYARSVKSGQTLLAVRTPDDRERDAVMIMRRHRVASLGGLPE